MQTESVLYKTSDWQVECQYKVTPEILKNPTAIVVKLFAYQIEFITNQWLPAVKGYMNTLYAEKLREKQDIENNSKFKLTWYSEEISNIIKQYE